jgi:hypothetical protein
MYIATLADEINILRQNFTSAILIIVEKEDTNRKKTNEREGSFLHVDHLAQTNREPGQIVIFDEVWDY